MARMSKCEECDYRQLMAKVFDMHFDILDCPKECEECDRLTDNQRKETEGNKI